jgi:flagellar protein FliO/FliZ
MDDYPPLSSFRRLNGLARPFRSVGVLLLLLFISPLFAVAQDTVIYPRSAAPAEIPAPARATGSNVTLLMMALAAAAAGGWLLWRQRRSPQGLNGREARKLNVTESRSLGNRQYLVVADYDGRKFLLGVCPGRIELLSPLEGNPSSRTP